MTSGQRPIVHIGYHKTATTWFQKAIWPSLDSHDWIPRKVTQAALLDPPGMHFDPAEARRVLALDTRDKPVVLSEENLSGYIHNGGLHGLMAPEAVRRIHAALPDARIVIFIRSQPDAIRASYSQYVAGGGTYSLDKYLHTYERVHGALKAPFKAPAFEWEHFEYDRLIALYDATFGRENVFVYPYEQLREPQALFERIEADLGVRFPPGVLDKRGANVSHSESGMEGLRFANRFTRQSVANKDWYMDPPGGHALRNIVRFLLKAMPGGPFRLPQGVADEIAAYYAPSNARLAELRDLPLAEMGYPLAR
ncbi:hypothetical protein GRI89_00730 [Altererythrobacter salegens]|uniref:Sulfotransferase domain-containing protein n=1 Tax=Croceibacterium salegens TaxID=1737568 RepID=A0A6I4SSR4_9SPHN|nr:hypothetical protein [Croceibacterium salegens]MXO58070.1 hypothetical protein [Croceibacterium salegens]